MTTFTVNENSKAAKAFIAFIKTLSFVQVKEEEKITYFEEEQAPYNKEFVEMVKKSASDKKGKLIDPTKLWENIK